MKKINKKQLSLIFTFALSLLNCANASFLWDINIGRNEFNQSNYHFAKDYFISYLENNPNDEDGYYSLALTYKKLNNETKAQENFKKSYDITSSKRNIEKISFNIKNSANIEDYFDMAVMYFDGGNLKEADFYADMMLKINPKSSSAYYIKAGIKNIEKNTELAKKYMKAAVVYNNELLDTNLARTLNITEIPESTAKVYNMFALESYYEGNIEKTIDYLKKSCAKEPNNPNYIAFLAQLYLIDNNIQEAKKILDLSKSYENNVPYLLVKAELSHLEKNKTNEMNYLLKAYKVNPNNQDVLFRLGNYYVEDKKYDLAKKFLEDLINVNNSYFEGEFLLAYTLNELGKTDLAAKKTRKIAALNPSASEINYLLSKICQKEGSYKEALEYINNAIKEDENPYYYLQQAHLHNVMFKYKESNESIKEAYELPYAPDNDDETNECLLINYLKLTDSAKAFELLKNYPDKNGIMYKYYMYKYYSIKKDFKKADNYHLEIKKFRPVSTKDFVNYSEIMNDFKGVDAAVKIVDNGLRKYPNDINLHSQKIKLYALSKNNPKRLEAVKKMQSVEI